MASPLDYVFTCNSCGEQYETGTPRGVDYEEALGLEWSFEDETDGNLPGMCILFGKLCFA